MAKLRLTEPLMLFNKTETRSTFSPTSPFNLPVAQQETKAPALKRFAENAKIQFNRGRWGVAGLLAVATGGYGGLIASAVTARKAGFGTKLMICAAGAIGTAVWAAMGHHWGVANLMGGAGASGNFGASSGSFLSPALWMSGSIATSAIGSFAVSVIAPENPALDGLCGTEAQTIRK